MKITKRQLKNLIMESLLSEGTSHVVGGAHYAQVGDYEVYVKDVIDTLKELGAQPVPVPIGSFAPSTLLAQKTWPSTSRLCNRVTGIGTVNLCMASFGMVWSTCLMVTTELRRESTPASILTFLLLMLILF